VGSFNGSYALQKVIVGVVGTVLVIELSECTRHQEKSDLDSKIRYLGIAGMHVTSSLVGHGDAMRSENDATEKVQLVGPPRPNPLRHPTGKLCSPVVRR
jgi:hypothetical protein